MALAIWWAFLYLFIVGLAAGWLAWVVLGKSKLLSKGKRQPNWGMLLLVGVAGSFVGGAAISLLSGNGVDLRASGMVASALGAIAVASVYLWVEGRKS